MKSIRLAVRWSLSNTALWATAVLVALATRAASQLPDLSISRSGGNVVIAWPAAATDYDLQSTGQLGVPNSWTAVQGSPVVQGAQLVWTGNFPEQTRFFRLSRRAGLPTPTGALTGALSTVGVPWAVTTDTDGPSAPIPGVGAGSVPRIVSFANADGSLDVAWTDTRTPPQIIVTHIVRDGAGYKAAWHLKVHTLAYLGGFARDETGSMYYLTTVAEDLTPQALPNGVHRPNIAHLVKLAPLGNQVFRTDLRTDVNWPGATPLYSPMTWGTARIAVGGGRVMTTFSCNTEFDPGVNSRHQWHVYMGINALTGQTDAYASAFGHSWDHRLIYHAGRFIGTSLGDAGLRGIGVADAAAPAHRVAFAIKGGDAPTVPFYQNTFTRLGDLAPGAAGYGLLFSTENTATYTGGASAVISSRNLAFVHVRSDFDTAAVNLDNMYDVSIVDTTAGNPAAQTFDVPIKDYWGSTFAGKNKGMVWLTSYTNRATENVERPKLVSLGDGRFLAIWEKWSLTAYDETFAAVLGEYGQILKGPNSIGRGVRLHRQDSAVAFGGGAAWVVGETAGPKLVLYTLDAALNLARFEIQ